MFAVENINNIIILSWTELLLITNYSLDKVKINTWVIKIKVKSLFTRNYFIYRFTYLLAKWIFCLKKHLLTLDWFDLLTFASNRWGLQQSLSLSTNDNVNTRFVKTQKKNKTFVSLMQTGGGGTSCIPSKNPKNCVIRIQ